jgi:hypothetical protein
MEPIQLTSISGLTLFVGARVMLNSCLAIGLIRAGSIALTRPP